MTATFAILALAIFIMGAVVGVIGIISIGIRREGRRFQQWRRRRLREGTWAGPKAPEHFLPEVPMDRASGSARRLTGLYVRRDDSTRREPTGPGPAAFLQLGRRA